MSCGNLIEKLFSRLNIKPTISSEPTPQVTTPSVERPTLGVVQSSGFFLLNVTSHNVLDRANYVVHFQSISSGCETVQRNENAGLPHSIVRLLPRHSFRAPISTPEITPWRRFRTVRRPPLLECGFDQVEDDRHAPAATGLRALMH